MNYKLATNDLKFLKEVIKIATDINNQYNMLTHIEIEGNKGSKEYKQQIENLKESIKKEDQLYNSISKDTKRCMLIAGYILETMIPRSFPPDFESVINQDSQNIIIRRVLNILTGIATSDYKEIQKAIPEELKETLNSLGLQDTGKILSQSLETSTEIKRALERDYFNVFLVLIEEARQNSKDLEEQGKLGKIKYDISFLRKDIDLVSSNFELPKALYLEAKLVANGYNIDNKMFKLFGNHYGTDIANKQIIELLLLSDKDYDEENKFCSILRQNYLRASFIFLDAETISDINSDFHDSIEGKGYLEEHSNDTISSEIIIDAFKKIKKDAEKYSVLSYNRK